MERLILCLKRGLTRGVENLLLIPLQLTAEVVHEGHVALTKARGELSKLRLLLTKTCNTGSARLL